MNNIRVLDCTLRDGGRIIDCAFPDNEIADISCRLAEAKIDIIEVGFLRDHRNVHYSGNSTFFTDVDQIRPFVDRKKDALYVAFIDYSMFDFDSLKPFDGTSIDGIRFGFTKKNYDENYDDILRCIKKVKESGYKLFIQGVNSLNYSDREILELVDMINEVHPYSFGIIDTYGAMYIDDVDRLYGLIDRNMDSDICINFHSHNNYQLSFAFAQEVIKLSNGTRKIVIDATLNGMGKVAGNLNTELIIDFLVRKLHYDYEFNDILDLIDDYIYKYSLKYEWGYSIPAMMAGIYKSHPNNIIYLTEKFRLATKDISSLLSMIDSSTRQWYDYDNIERLYVEFVADKIEDRKTLSELRGKMEGHEVLVLAPGNSLNTHRKLIRDYTDSQDVIVISANFVAEDYPNAYHFFGNSKRYAKLKKERISGQTIITSNVKADCGDDMIVNYHSLINRGYRYFENTMIMLLNLLKKLNPSKITIAGFDGFSSEKKNNYIDSDFQNERHIDEFEQLNAEVSAMFLDIKQTLAEKCEIQFLTPSLYEKREMQ